MRPITDREVARGPVLQPLARVPVIDTISGMAVHLVDAGIPRDVRWSLARVAYVGQRTMTNYKTGYDGTITEADQRLYILARGKRAVGCVISALEDRFWYLAWDSSDRITLQREEPEFTRRPTIGRVWIAPQEQRKGLGVALVRAVFTHLAVSPQDIGWILPFTAAGGRLVKMLCPTWFLGVTDPMTLDKILHRGAGAT